MSPLKTVLFMLTWGGDVAQLVERRTGMLLTRVRLPGAARHFSPRVNFQCRLSYGVRTIPCAIACIYICAHVKDPVVHVRVWWIMETLKRLACNAGLGRATLSQLAFPGEGNQNFTWEKSHWDNHSIIIIIMIIINALTARVAGAPQMIL